MSFSVRVHPAPFSPTPNRHAGIKLEMKGGGPGGSRFELVGLLDPQRKEHARHLGPQKRGRQFEISLVFCEAIRSRQQPYAPSLLLPGVR